MSEFLWYFNLVASVPVALAYAMLTYGFLRYAPQGDHLVFWLTRACGGLCIAVAFGTVGWNAVLLTAGDYTPLIQMRVGYTILMVMFSASALFMLEFFRALIPEQDRKLWPLWVAPLYPKAKCWIIRG